jgi:hypothetical protein
MAWRQNKAFRGSMQSTTSTMSSLPSIDEDNEVRAAFLLEQELTDGEGDSGTESDEDDDSWMLAGSPVRSQPGSPVRSQPGSPVRSPRSMGGRCAPCTDQALMGASSCATVLSLHAIVQSDADRGDEAACDVAKKALSTQLEEPDSLSLFLALMQPFVEDSVDDEQLPPIEVVKNSPTPVPAARMPRHVVRSAGEKLSSQLLDGQVHQQVSRGPPCDALDGAGSYSTACSASLSDCQIDGNLDSIAQLLSYGARITR